MFFVCRDYCFASEDLTGMVPYIVVIEIWQCFFIWQICCIPSRLFKLKPDLTLDDETDFSTSRKHCRIKKLRTFEHMDKLFVNKKL